MRHEYGSRPSGNFSGRYGYCAAGPSGSFFGGGLGYRAGRLPRYDCLVIVVRLSRPAGLGDVRLLTKGGVSPRLTSSIFGSAGTGGGVADGGASSSLPGKNSGSGVAVDDLSTFLLRLPVLTEPS